MGFILSLRMYESLRMSEITIAIKSHGCAQPISIQVSFQLRTFLSFLTFLNLEWMPLLFIIIPDINACAQHFQAVENWAVLIVIKCLLFSVPPLDVRILGSSQALSANRRYDLLCQSSGSRPPASVTWWKNGQRLEHTKETVSLP